MASSTLFETLSNDSELIGRCGICKRLPRSPKRLKCLHVYCEVCIANYITRSVQRLENQQRLQPEIKCPTCFTIMPADILKVSDDRISECIKILDEVQNGRPQAMCVIDYDAIDGYCKTCDRYVCKTCPCSSQETCDVDLKYAVDERTLSSDSIVSTGDSIARLVASTTEAQSNLVDIVKASETHVKQTKENVSVYYCKLRDEINQYINKEEDRMLEEIDKQFEVEKTSCNERDAGFKTILKEMEEMKSIVNNPEVNKPDSQDSPVACHQLMSSIMDSVEGVEDLLASFRPEQMCLQFRTHPDVQQGIMAASFADLHISRRYDVGSAGEESNELSPTLGEDNYDGYVETQMAPSGSGNIPSANRPCTPPPAYDDIVNVTPSAPSAPALEESNQAAAPCQYEFAIRSHSFRTILQDDREVGYAVGVKWIGERIIMADRWNKRLKLYSSSGKFLQQMTFGWSSEPWDVAVIPLDPAQQRPKFFDKKEPRFCLVPIPKNNTISKIMVPHEGKLEIAASIRTAEGYACLAYNPSNSTMVCGVCQPFGLPRVDVLDYFKPNVLKSYALGDHRKQLFTYPRSIDISQFGTIVVCDWTQHCVLFIRNDGFILGCYRGTPEKPLREPIGTSIDSSGLVYVADKKTHSIHIMRLDGSAVCIMGTDVDLYEPREISVSPDHTTPKFALSHGSGLVTIFKLTEGGPLSSNSATY